MGCYPRVEGFQTSPQYYTIHSPRYDGFGAQYHALMSGVAYSASRGLTYVHTPMGNVAHGHHGVKVDEMNEFMGIKTSPMAAEVNDVQVESYSEEVHYTDTPSVYYTPEVIQKLKDYYYSAPKPSVEQNDIAIHVRRGDVGKENGGNEKDKHGVEFSRFTSNDEYKRMISALKKEYPTYAITLHSQGNLADFSDLLGENISCKLNEDIRQTFHSFVTAKVFVMAKSSLSYSAAILNEGTVYYQEFWHKPLDGWKNAPTE
jgi:hypothetical protein